MINLSTLDYSIIIIFFSITLFIGIWVSKKSGKNTSEYFLSGRTMPWWLLGLSMVATTFSTDTPNYVTDVVRQNGVSSNWEWWAFLLTGMLTVFVYAKLWRKSNVKTDMEFYELRYGGKPARFLRAFRALYLGIAFNVFAMAAVSLAAIKIGGIMFGLEPIHTLLIGGIITVIFSSLGGFKGVVYTDFILFFVAMVGAIGAAIYLVDLPEVGGLSNLISHENVIDKLDIIPSTDNTELYITLFIIPLAVQWWSTWYPGAEPGGGGYIAQRMLAAKDENHAIGATFFFNIMHYALRPWPWILVALASLIVFPDIASIKEAFPGIADDKLGHDLAYSAMLTKLPSGLLGLVVASLVAAYMSTISTHLNWGSSYIVNDFYKEHIKKDATEKQLVNVGKLSTVILMLFSALLALFLTNAKQIFDIIIMFGAGTGAIFILRWFWWRINAWAEIIAMISSGIISILFKLTPVGVYLFGNDENYGVFKSWADKPISVLITTAIWVTTMYLTKPEKNETLVNFYKKIRPGGRGWKKITNNMENYSENQEEKNALPQGILAMLVGCCLIYSCLFATGYWIYGETTSALIATTSALVSAFILSKLWAKIKTNIL